MLYVSIILFIIICILCFLLHKKQVVDTIEKVKFENELREIQNEINRNEDDLNELLDDIEIAENKYKKLYNEELNNINTTIENTKKQQEEQLSNYLREKKSNVEIAIQNMEQTYEEKKCALDNEYKDYETTICAQISDYMNKLNDQQQLYESILGPLKQYEKDQQEKLFYTIQVPEEYREDINYLLTVVNAQVKHPDIISKLVWAEYIKPYMDDMIKRVGIKDEPGIYKITNIDSGKSYVGKSTNVKKRLQDHIKSSVGISSIADQFVHHEILKTGLWNWTFEVITYCDKDKLSELEKYYINFFKTQEFGYNRKEGG